MSSNVLEFLGTGKKKNRVAEKGPIKARTLQGEKKGPSRTGANGARKKARGGGVMLSGFERRFDGEIINSQNKIK